MKNKVLRHWLICFACMAIPLNAQDYLITEYGARSGLSFLNTEAINLAVTRCSETGGGRVVIPAGTFVSGTIELKDHVELHLMSGAVLKAPTRLEDFSGGKEGQALNENVASLGLIIANRAKNISISGGGTIDLSGEHFKIPGEMHVSGVLDKSYIRQGAEYQKAGVYRADGPVKMKKRPGFMINLSHCEGILIRDITILDSPHWAVRIGDSRNIRIIGVNLFNDPMIPNSDGIHITSSENVTVSDCHLTCGDDALCFTGFGEPGNPTRNVVVQNCILQSRSSAIRIGYGDADVRNLTFSNILIKESNRGIGIFTRNRGSVSNVLFSNVIMQTRLHAGWWGTGEPIHISAIRQEDQDTLGTISSIHFDNISATAEQGIVVYGDEEEVIRDITFEDLSLTILDGKESRTYGGNMDLRPTRHQKDEIFSHDIPGMFCRNVHTLSIRGFDLQWGENLAPYFSSGLECRNVKGLTIESFFGGAAPVSVDRSAFSLHETEVRAIRHCILLEP